MGARRDQNCGEGAGAPGGVDLTAKPPVGGGAGGLRLPAGGPAGIYIKL